MVAAKRTNDPLWRLRQLGYLGLPVHIYVPAFLNELHDLIESQSNSYCWLNKRREIINVYDELQNGPALQCASRLGDMNHAACVEAVSGWIKMLERPVSSSEQIPDCPHLRRAYRQALLKLGYANTLFLPISQPPSTTRIGILMLHRGKDAPEFSNSEKNLMRRAAALLAQGLNQQPMSGVRMTDGWQQGLIVVDKTGKIKHACSAGEKLLSLACRREHQPIYETASHLNQRIFKGVDDLIDKVLSRNEVGTVADNNVTLSTSNAWGEFKIHGFLLEDTHGSRAPQICLNIKWQVPFVLKLFHNLRLLELTPRQETVALLYAAGHPTKTMASKLDLSQHTVKEHIHNIFDRLQIHSRAELIENILCQEQGLP